MAIISNHTKFLKVFSEGIQVAKWRMDSLVGFSLYHEPFENTNKFLFEMDEEDGSPDDPIRLFYTTHSEAKAAYDTVHDAKLNATSAELHVDVEANPLFYYTVSIAKWEKEAPKE